MDFYNGQFDCVIDKGTLDSVYVIFSIFCDKIIFYINL